MSWRTGTPTSGIRNPAKDNFFGVLKDASNVRKPEEERTRTMKKNKWGVLVAVVALLAVVTVQAQSVQVSVDAVKSQYVSFAIGNGATRTAIVSNGTLYTVWYPISLCQNIGSASNITTISYRAAGGTSARVLVTGYAVTARETPVSLATLPPLKKGDIYTIVSGAATNVAAGYNLVYGLGVDSGK